MRRSAIIYRTCLECALPDSLYKTRTHLKRQMRGQIVEQIVVRYVFLCVCVSLRTCCDAHENAHGNVITSTTGDGMSNILLQLIACEPTIS